MNKSLILVAIGGLAGSVARYLAASFVDKMFSSAFPYGTFTVNLVGCLLIGIVVGLSERFDWLPEWRILLTTGFCGGFTTFSAFAYENILLLQDKDYMTFAAYSFLSFALGLTAILVGLFLAKG